MSNLQTVMARNNTSVAKMWQGFYETNMENPPFKPAYLQRPADKSLSKYWYVCFWVWSETHQKLVRKRITISGDSVRNREKQAAAIITEVNERLESGVVVDPLPIENPKEETANVQPHKNITIEEAIKHHLAIKAKTLKDRAYETYQSNARTFEEFLKSKSLLKKPLRNFGVDQAHAYADWILLEKKLSNKSHNKHKGFASGIFNEFVDREIIPKNPFKKIKKLRTTQGKHRVFSSAQIKEFRQLCVQHNDDATWFFVCFIYYTFMRPHEEARMVKVQDIGEKTILVTEINAKMSRVRHVMIPPPLEEMLQKRRIRDYPPHYYVFSHNGTPSPKLVGDSYWYRRHTKFMKLMGLYGFDFDLYGWKHTGATALFKATKDLMLVQEQCGHSDVKQTVEYLRDLGVLYYESQIEKFPAI
jgi:integrase